MTNIFSPADSYEISTRARHALAAMVDIAKRQGKNPVPLSDIAASLRISLSYLEQMFSGLRRHGLVKSHRGPGGGYVLALPAYEINIAAIFNAADDVPAQKASRNEKFYDVATSKLWQFLGLHVHSLLKIVTLEDVVLERVEVYQKVFKTHP